MISRTAAFSSQTLAEDFPTVVHVLYIEMYETRITVIKSKQILYKNIKSLTLSNKPPLQSFTSDHSILIHTILEKL